MPVCKRISSLVALCAAVLLAGAAAPPQRVMSLKLCTDALLLDLAPPHRIASVSYLSQEKAALRWWPQAAHLPVNHNTPEEVLAAQPDLILTDAYTAPAMRRALARTGARILAVPEARDFAGIRANVRLVAAALGEAARGEALIARMDATLAALQAMPPARPVRVLGWGGGGYLPGDALFNTILKTAGAVNIAPDWDSYFDIEQVLVARPDVLLYGDQYADTPSLRDAANAHPALMRWFATRRVVYPALLTNCGVPESADAARILRAALTAAMQKPGGAP